MTGYLLSLTHGASGGRSLWPRPSPLSGAADDRPRWPVRHGASAAGGRRNEAAFRAIGSHLQQARCEQRQGSVLTRPSDARLSEISGRRGQLPEMAAGSTDRRNTFCELLSWGLIEQGIALAETAREFPVIS